MAVFDNFKNFIRQGKQAGTKNVPSKHTVETSSSPEANFAEKAHFKSPMPLDNESDRSPKQKSSRSTSGNQTSVSKKNKQHKYDNAVKRIIEEENRSQSQMPNYPGLEKYVLLQKMGDGAFSIVYRAREIENGEPRAIKIVSKHNLTPSQRSSVLKEAAIMRQLDHPNIVHMYAFLETSKHYFIVLELVEGGELFHQIVQLTYFSEDLSRHVILQVAHAVRYLHEEAGVVHRDIKPENLLFTHIPFKSSRQRVFRPGDDDSKQDEGEFIEGIGGGGVGTIKLADFGLSKIIWDSKTMTPCGTVGYTAPEIVKDEKYSKSVDMWALGCVLYTILCGFPPFYDESIEALTHKVAMGKYSFLSPWWDGISDSAKDLVSRLLTVNPNNRLTIDEFLRHPWITRETQQTLALDSEVSSHIASYGVVPDTPLNERGGFRSGALKDAFDVSNAVYRLEQDMNRRNQKQRSTAIIEEEGEAAEFAHIEHVFDKVSISSNGSRTNSARTSRGNGVTSDVSNTRSAAKIAAALLPNANTAAVFDLHLEGSTLLERRKARQTPVAN